jgi:transketolase
VTKKEIELVATRKAYGKVLVELGREDPRIVVLDADLSKSTQTYAFGKQFPERFFDMGVAEQDMIGTAAGLAASGKIVFASTFAVFGSGRCWDQIRVSVAYPRQNVKIVVTHGGITVGEDGVTHQALEDIAIMRAMPNMLVIVPADGNETESVIRKIAKTNGPAYVRLGRPEIPLVYKEKPNFEIGKGDRLKKGDDIVIIACGIMVQAALEAAAVLKKEKIDAAVVNMSSIKPIDKKLIIEMAKSTRAVVTAEEHSIIGGLGGAVAEILSEECPRPLVRVGVPDMFCESGKPSELLVKYGLTAEDITIAVRSVLKRSKTVMTNHK